MVWCGVVWCGVVWCGVAWCGDEIHGAHGQGRRRTVGKGSGESTAIGWGQRHRHRVVGRAQRGEGGEGRRRRERGGQTEEEGAGRRGQGRNRRVGRKVRLRVCEGNTQMHSHSQQRGGRRVFVRTPQLPPSPRIHAHVRTGFWIWGWRFCQGSGELRRRDANAM